MGKLSTVLALLAAAAALQACNSAPISADGSAGRGQRSEEAADPVAAASSGAGAATVAAAWWQSDLSLLTHLSDENFTDALANTEYAVVIFFAPYSGHCKRARHTFAAAAPDIRERHPHVLLAQFDAYGPREDHNTTFGRRYAPRGFPVICWFVNATLADDRTFSRTREGFISFVDEHLKPAFKPVERASDPAPDPAGGSRPSGASFSAGDRQEL